MLHFQYVTKWFCYEMKYQHPLMSMLRKTPSFSDYDEKNKYDTNHSPSHCSLIFDNEETETEYTHPILFSELVFQKEFISLQNFLLKQYGDKLTCKEFINLTDEQLLNLPYFGTNKLELYHRMKNYISAMDSYDNSTSIGIDSSSSWPDRDELSEWAINYVLLSEPQQKLMDKISNKLGISVNQLNLANLVHDVDLSLMKTTVSGNRFDVVYKELLGILKNEFQFVYGKSIDEIKKNYKWANAK